MNREPATASDRDDSRREVARQLRITNAAFPSLRLTEEAVIAYTEALDMYAADTIAEGFRMARTDAERNQTHHPRPAEVRRYAAMYAKQRSGHQARYADSDAAMPYCPECASRSLVDDGSAFGRFSVAHASSCSQHGALPPNVRFWVQGSTPASFDQQQPEVVARLNQIPRGNAGFRKPEPAAPAVPAPEPPNAPPAQAPFSPEFANV